MASALFVSVYMCVHVCMTVCVFKAAMMWRNLNPWHQTVCEMARVQTAACSEWLMLYQRCALITPTHTRVQNTGLWDSLFILTLMSFQTSNKDGDSWGYWPQNLKPLSLIRNKVMHGLWQVCLTFTRIIYEIAMRRYQRTAGLVGPLMEIEMQYLCVYCTWTPICAICVDMTTKCMTSQFSGPLGDCGWIITNAVVSQREVAKSPCDWLLCRDS